MLVLIPFFWPFLAGGFIAFWIFKNLASQPLKFILACFILIPTIIFGSIWTTVLLGFEELSPGKIQIESPQVMSLPETTPTNFPVETTPSAEKNMSEYFSETDKAEANDRAVSLVVRVIDGDTIEIEDGIRVRLIGINTPELGDSRTSAECFAREAYFKTKELLEGQTIALERDVSETDRYGRLLRYIYLEDVFINELLVRQGFAYASSYPPDVKYQEILSKAEKEAREESAGLWSLCNISPEPTDSEASILKPTVFAPVSGEYTCNCSKTCTEISSCEEAQYLLNVCGCAARDADKDGIACDGVPLKCQN